MSLVEDVADAVGGDPRRGVILCAILERVEMIEAMGVTMEAYELEATPELWWAVKRELWEAGYRADVEGLACFLDGPTTLHVVEECEHVRAVWTQRSRDSQIHLSDGGAQARRLLGDVAAPPVDPAMQPLHDALATWGRVASGG